MKPENELTMEFMSRSCNEAFARAAVGAFIAPLDPDLEELSDIKTAVSEAVTNCIVHAYPEKCGEITLSCRVYPDRTVELRVEDQGVGIPDITAAREPMFTTGGQDRSGMGFTIMEKFMSSLQVESQPGKGTAVTMTRRLQERKP
jgi:stage II sporulation protein AB (anti-sigma F factor)